MADAPEELDPEVLTAFGDVAKELDLPQDAAQKVLDKVAPVIQGKTSQSYRTSKRQNGLIQSQIRPRIWW